MVIFQSLEAISYIRFLRGNNHLFHMSIAADVQDYFEGLIKPLVTNEIPRKTFRSIPGKNSGKI